MSTALYTTVANVEAITGQSFGTATTPSINQVTSMIGWASREVDLFTSTCWGTTLVSQEVIDFDINKSGNDYPYGSDSYLPQGRNDPFTPLTRNSFKLSNYPIISVGTAEYNNSLDINQLENWVSMSEGTGSDFIVNKDIGKVILTGNVIPQLGYRRFRFTYVYGRDVIPSYIERLTTLLVQREVLVTKLSQGNISSTDSITIGPITISKGGNSVNQNIAIVNREIDVLFAKVGINSVELI